MSTPKLKLWPIRGINLYTLPKVYADEFKKPSANDSDCIPVQAQTVQVAKTHKPCTVSTSSNVVSLWS